MKKRLLFTSLFLFSMLFMALNISAQAYHFEEGFATSSLPDGWTSNNIATGDWSSIPNVTFPTQTFGVKMKVSDPGSSWLQMPQVIGATDITFTCFVKNADGNLAVKLQSSTDGTTWNDVATTFTGMDLLNLVDKQTVTATLNIDGAVSLRFYAYTSDGVFSTQGAFYVDDIQLGKPAAALDDVSLTALMVDSSLIAGFENATTSYTMDVSHAMDYTVSATANNPAATIAITQVSDIVGTEADRTATVLITGEDGTSTATFTIVFTRTDYWYKEAFTGAPSLVGWTRNRTFESANIKIAGNQDLYGGEKAFKFTGGPVEDYGFLLSPKLINVGTLTFWTGEEEDFAGHNLSIYIKKGADSTMVFELDDTELTVGWQEVELVLEETTDSIQIMIVGICDIGDASTSRLWIDDLLLTYYEAPVIGNDDATLASLSVGGTAVAGFDAGVFAYTMELSPIQDYTVSAEATSTEATVAITQVSNITGTEAERTATVLVTAEDGTTTATYTIVLSQTGTNVSEFNSAEVIFYPNPVRNMITLQMPDNTYNRLDIFNVMGQQVMQLEIRSGQRNINVETLKEGLYFISLTGEAETFTAKFIKE